MDIISYLLQANDVIDFSFKIAMISFLVGTIAGFIDATVGGGGLVAYPCLAMIGIPPHIILATNKFQAACGTISSTWHFYKKNLIDIKSYFPLAFFLTILWAIFGAIVLQGTPSSVLGKIVPIIMIAIFVYRVFTFKSGLHPSPKPLITKMVFIIVFTAILGFYDGFFGPGVGSLWIFAFTTFAGMTAVQASANTKLLNLASNIGSLIIFIPMGVVCYKVGIMMGVGQVIGAKFGVYISVKKGSRFINIMFLTVLFVMISKMIIQYYV